MEELLDRLKKFREDFGMPYKRIADKCDIKPSTFYNFSSGLRKLTPDAAERLNQFLIQKGY